jgi:acyl-homoserine lactone acylase PvdQ
MESTCAWSGAARIVLRVKIEGRNTARELFRFATQAIPAALALAAALAFVKGASPSSAQTPSGQVTLYRDDWGVPHLYGGREEDGFYGLGYAQAEDQLERLLQMYLNARGEQSRAFGPDHVESDYGQRLWRHREEAIAAFPRLSPELQRNYRAYVAGVNRYLADHPGEVPDWAPRLEPWDPIALSRAILWLEFQAGDGLRDCQRGGVKLAQQPGRSRLDATGSNEWVLAPWRTADAATVVLSDPHGGLVFGSYLHEFRIDAGALKTAGYAIGALFILTHTRDVSWGMTIGAPDASDCYEIELDATNPRRYRYQGEWKELVRHPTAIPVKGGKPVKRTLEYALHNGVLSPVVARVGTKAFVVSTPYMDQAGRFDEEIYRLNLAKNVAEIRAAMSGLGMYPQNLMFGDREGGTLYVRAGRTPKRPSGFDWSRPVPGNTAATAWLGIHPIDDLVQIMNPVQGYIQNNNIAPDMTIEGGPIRAEQYPSYIFNDIPGRINSRGLRAVERLRAMFRASFADLVDLALDEKWMGTEAWLAALGSALAGRPEVVRDWPASNRALADRLLRFDGMARATSIPALSYHYWRDAVISAAGRSGLTEVAKVVFDGAPMTAGTAELLLSGIERARVTMMTRHGSTDLAYGDVFRVGRGGVSLPLGGGDLTPSDRSLCTVHRLICVATLRAFTFGAPDSLGQRWAFSGSRLLRLVQFTEPLRSFTLHIYGQSERPSSPHFADQARLFSERRLKPTHFHRDELLQHVTSSRVLRVTVP